MAFSDWEVIDDGAWNGMRRLARYSDEDEGTAQIKTEALDSGVIEANKRADPIDKRSEMWRVGSIPASLGMKWLVEEGLDMWNPHHEDGIMKKLMDSDYRHLVPGLDRILF